MQVPWSSDFALYLEDYLMYVHHTFEKESVRPNVWPQNKCRSLWPIFLMQIVGQTLLNLMTWTCGSWSEDQHDLYFTVQWFCLIRYKTFWCMYIILSEYESVQPDAWPKNKSRSLWPIFFGPVIVPYTLKTTVQDKGFFISLLAPGW